MARIKRKQREEIDANLLESLHPSNSVSMRPKRLQSLHYQQMCSHMKLIHAPIEWDINDSLSSPDLLKN